MPAGFMALPSCTSGRGVRGRRGPLGCYRFPILGYDHCPATRLPRCTATGHIEVDKALYSIPGELIGQQVKKCLKPIPSWSRCSLSGPADQGPPPESPAGQRRTDPEDLPADKTAYAMRDIDHLRRMAAAEGGAIGVYADALLAGPLPWTKMRQVYALLGLVKKCE